MPIVISMNVFSFNHTMLIPESGQICFNPIAYGGRGGGGGFLAHTIRLEATTLEPFHIESPKFLTSLYAFWTHCGKISGRLICQGGAVVIFRTRGHEK